MFKEGHKRERYGERLQMLGMTTLETRRISGDLIEVFKIMKGFDKVEEQHFLTEQWAAQEGMISNWLSLDVG